MKNRKIELYDRHMFKGKVSGAPGREKILEGSFHQWAQEGGEGGDPVAIVELEGGEVETWPASMCRFIDSPED